MEIRWRKRRILSSSDTVFFIAVLGTHEGVCPPICLDLMVESVLPFWRRMLCACVVDVEFEPAHVITDVAPTPTLQLALEVEGKPISSRFLSIIRSLIFCFTCFSENDG